jgi:hypothetical protein
LLIATAALFDHRENAGNGFISRLSAEVAFAVNANADGIGFHVALSDHKHGVDFDLLSEELLGNES